MTLESLPSDVLSLIIMSGLSIPDYRNLRLASKKLAAILGGNAQLVLQFGNVITR